MKKNSEILFPYDITQGSWKVSERWGEKMGMKSSRPLSVVLMFQMNLFLGLMFATGLQVAWIVILFF